MMVINSTNMNKTNNKLSSLLNTKKTYDVGNPGPGWAQAQKCNGVKSVNGMTTLPPLLITGS